MNKRKPGLEKAIAYLSEGIGTNRFGDRLPSVRLLAAAAQVSFVTMWKAVNLLKERKMVAKTGSGYRTVIVQPEAAGALGAARPGGDIEPTGALWQKVKTRIRKDILCGRYAAGEPLPSIKELENHYDVSFRTVKKSLEALAAEEIVRAHKKGYGVPPITASDSNARITAIACGWEDATIWADYQDKNYFRQLESECILSKIALDVVVYFRRNGRLCFIHSATQQPYDLKNDNILGIAFIVANLEFRPEEVLRELDALKKPIAVLDVIGGWKIPALCAPQHFMQFFTVTASINPAKQVAKYLLALGHARIAFISPFHKAHWSRRRLEGVAAIYRDAGMPAGVTAFVLEKYAFQWDFLENLDTQDDVQSLIRQYDKWKVSAHSKFFRKFGNISYSISKYLTQQNCATGEIYQRMRPIFDTALRDAGITAWVLSNDYAATLALDYLKEKKIKVPDNLSVIAFDNTIDAMEYQLTSYDFNNNGIINSMLRYIVFPSSIPLQLRNRFIEAEGRIVERRSTQRPLNNISKNAI